MRKKIPPGTPLLEETIREIDLEQRRIAAKILGLPDPTKRRPRKGFMRRPIRNLFMLAAAGYGVYLGYEKGVPLYQEVSTYGCSQRYGEDFLPYVRREGTRFLSTMRQPYTINADQVRVRICPSESDDQNILLTLSRGTIVRGRETFQQFDDLRSYDGIKYVPIETTRENGEVVRAYIDRQYLTPLNLNQAPRVK